MTYPNGYAALWAPLDDEERAQQAVYDAHRESVRNAALRILGQLSTELAQVAPEDTSARRIDLRGCMKGEIRRAAEHGATLDQVRAVIDDLELIREAIHEAKETTR